MAKTTVSVPDSLREEMDQLSGINWSLVAQQAFQRVINNERQKHQLIEDNDMTTAAKRIMASKLAFDEKQMDRVVPLALEAGAHWAKEVATYEQLASMAQNLEAYDGEIDVCAGSLATSLVGYGLTPDETFAAIEEANEPPHEFWNWTIGLSDDLFPLAMGEDTREQFASHFVEGALEVWGKVESELS